MKNKGKMCSLIRNVTNAIWHAFNALYQEEPGCVNKTKLKVLTANIASILDLYGVEKGLDHFRSTNSLNFEQFVSYLSQEVFSSLPNSLNMTVIRNYEEKIEEICWLICRKNYLPKTIKSLQDEDYYRIFRIFCLLSDFQANPNIPNSYQVVIHSSEIKLFMEQLMSTLGLDPENDSNFNSVTKKDDFYKFGDFLDLIDFEDRVNLNEYEEPLHEAISEMYEVYIKDIIKKGYLLRRGYVLPTFKEYWFVLQPCELTYYKNQCQKEICGSISLDPKCTVKPWSAIAGKNERFLKFVLSSGERNFELGAYEHRLRMQWIAALQLAITYSTGREGFQRDSISRRRKRREIDMKLRKDEEQIRSVHLKEVELTRSQLEKEKLARMAAENQAEKMKIIALEDSRRVAELEDLKITLEKLLEEETQAKRDEEIVRALQARVLAEEWEKREELESLQKEQKCLLEQERQKRMEFECKQQEKENQLKEAELRLKELEEERKKLDFELKQARFKIIQFEDNKEDLESRLDAINANYTRSGSGIRRTFSFVVPSRERHAALEYKAASLRRTVKRKE